MTAHTWHERTSRLLDPILFDDCDRCREHAEAGGLDLDFNLYAQAWDRMVEVEKHDGSYRSHNEALLCRYLYRMALVMERHFSIYPWRPIPAIALVQVAGTSAAKALMSDFFARMRSG